MKKLLTLLLCFALVAGVSWGGEGTTAEDKSGVDVIVKTIQPRFSSGFAQTDLGILPSLTRASFATFTWMQESYTQGPAAVSADGAFDGGVLMPNGKVCLVPFRSDYIGIYDPVTNTYTQGPAAVSADGAFIGGVLLPNGKVCLVPCNSDYIGIYDPVAGSVDEHTCLSPWLNKY